MEFFKESFEFEWDAGNVDKNWIKHRVSQEECEEAFFDPHKRLLGESVALEDGEKRYLQLGRTSKNRLLFIVFTMRRTKIRVISARDLNHREKKRYEK